MSEKPSAAEQSELNAVFAKIDAEIGEQQLHPILKHVLPLMQNEEATWFPQGMPLERVEEIKTLIDAAIADKTIVKAMVSLLKAAAAVGQVPGGKMAGAHLMRLCEQIITEKNLMAMVNTSAEFAPGTLEKAKGITGAADRATPAKVGEKAPEGSLRIDQLAGNKRRM